MMSEIDQYDHTCLGIVACPSRHEPFPYWNHEVPLYRFDSNATHPSDSFQAERSDLLLGGGGGECAALRISIPQALWFFTREDWDDWRSLDEIICAYWTMTEAFIFCDGYARIGWRPERDRIEFWLTKHLLAFIVREYPDQYGSYAGSRALDFDGSIFRLPTAGERLTLDRNLSS